MYTVSSMVSLYLITKIKDSFTSMTCKEWVTVLHRAWVFSNCVVVMLYSLLLPIDIDKTPCLISSTWSDANQVGISWTVSLPVTCEAAMLLCGIFTSKLFNKTSVAILEHWIFKSSNAGALCIKDFTLNATRRTSLPLHLLYVKIDVRFSFSILRHFSMTTSSTRIIL